jgi:hypothetical protein
MDKKYYAERVGAKVESYDFDTLKAVFLLKFEELERGLFFQEATGYKCVDRGQIPGTWGDNPESFFFIRLRFHNLWPIQKNIANYDEVKLFSVIEFLFDYVSEPENKWNHKWDNCGWHASNYDKEKGKIKYRAELNQILKEYKSGYELSDAGEVMQISPSGLETIIAEIPKTSAPKNIDDRVHSAVAKYRRYSATIDDKKDAVRALADVLEFLKKDGIKFAEKDDSDIFRIINGFDVRHHNREQQGQYDKEIWYDWMFYTFLSSIYTLLKLKAKYGSVN